MEDLLRTQLQSAESWAVLVTAGVLVFTAAAASGRFFLQPLGNNWYVHAGSARLRRSGGHWAYIVTLNVENGSAAGQRIMGWWRRVTFPEDNPSYDPNWAPAISSRKDAREHYDSEGILQWYPLAPGKSFRDQMIRFEGSNVHEICYVEYTLEYRRWRFLPYPSRVPEFASQTLIISVEREDLASRAVQPREAWPLVSSLQGSGRAFGAVIEAIASFIGRGWPPTKRAEP